MLSVTLAPQSWLLSPLLGTQEGDARPFPGTRLTGEMYLATHSLLLAIK